MNILMFDTSMDALVVGVARSFDQKVDCRANLDQIFCEQSQAVVRHSEILLPMIENCLAKAEVDIEDVDLIACTSGPGSFTGLRIGMATAKGLSLARSTPWVCLPTLDTLAAEFAGSERLVVPVIDARKKRFYAALYKNGVRMSDYLDLTPDDLVALILKSCTPDGGILVTGQANTILDALRASKCDATFGAGDLKTRFRHFAGLAVDRFSRFGPAPEDAVPLYIREPEIGPQP